jgi:hypothetical protein
LQKRVPKYRGSIDVFFNLDSREDRDWWDELGGETLFTFKRGCLFKGSPLLPGLRDAISRKDKDAAQALLIQLGQYTETSYNDLSDHEKWERTALSMAEDIGGRRQREEGEILTLRASGRVLETMCGFNTYFWDVEHIEEVVVLDGCRAMLERYILPDRLRILYDLERVVGVEAMGFFSEGEFQTVGCWGSNYLTHPVPVFVEFHRVLSDGGKLLILESTTEGYRDLVKRFFDPRVCAGFMQEAGFSTEIEELTTFKLEGQPGDYYLVTGTK